VKSIWKTLGHSLLRFVLIIVLLPMFAKGTDPSLSGFVIFTVLTVGLFTELVGHLLTEEGVKWWHGLAATAIVSCIAGVAVREV
jgi:hypothetical protein